MRLAAWALATSIAPFITAALAYVVSLAFPIVEHRRDGAAAIAIGVLSLVTLAAWPVGLGTSILAVRRAEPGAARSVSRAALSVSVLGGLALASACGLFAILVAGLSMR